MLHTNDSSQASNEEASPTTSLHPMGFTDILDVTFSLYRNHFRLFLGICAIYFVVDLGSALVSGMVLFFLNTISYKVIDWMIRFCAILVFYCVAGGLVFASAQTFLGRHITIRAALLQVKRRFWPYVGSGLLWLLVVAAPGISITVGAWMISIIGPDPAVRVGVLAITVVGIAVAIYLGTRWSFYSFAAVVEENSTIGALSRSSELVEGAWWRVFGIMLAIFLLSFMIGLVLMVASIFFLTLTGIASGEGSLMEMIKIILESSNIGDRFYYVMQICIISAVTIFIVPIMVIGTTLLYFDQRIRKEGFDIEMRVAKDKV